MFVVWFPKIHAVHLIQICLNRGEEMCFVHASQNTRLLGMAVVLSMQFLKADILNLMLFNFSRVGKRVSIMHASKDMLLGSQLFLYD